MPAERAGYTVTMFLIDVSPSMGDMVTIDLPLGDNGTKRTRQITKLEWILEFVMLKVQEMVFHGRKTEQCGVILFGTHDTDNIVNRENDGYEHVTEFMSIGQPNATTLTKLMSIRPSTVIGDPIDAIIVGIETQGRYLARKATWTRKMVLLTDGENPMEIEDWQATVNKMNELNIQTSIIGANFDDENMPFYEKYKSNIKRQNETFYAKFSNALNDCVMGTAAFALEECNKPDIKMTKSALLANKLRVGDVTTRPEEAIELNIKTSKCTALSRPPSMKKFGKREAPQEDEMDADGDQGVFALLSSKSCYVVKQENSEAMDVDDEQEESEEVVEKEDLVRGYKYGASFVPIESEEDFRRLEPKTGIDICGFFPSKHFRRDWSMGEVQYVWADPNSARDQIAFSSMVQAMFEKQAMAIARLVNRGDPKMGVLMPCMLENVDCFLWVQVPFADDLRKFTFRSLDRLFTKKGETVTKHPFLPTQEQMTAMDKFVDCMDLTNAGGEDDAGNSLPWFDPAQAYNPAIHRLKQALFHGAITSDLSKNPLSSPHPELTKYFNPPPELLARAHGAIENCRSAFKVKRAPPKTVKRRKDGHVAGDVEDEGVIDLGPPVARPEQNVKPVSPPKESPIRKSMHMDADSATEEDSDAEDAPINKKKPSVPAHTVFKDQNPIVSREKSSQKISTAPSPAQSMAHMPPNAGRAPGRIIGNATPLEDFKQNIKYGDVVSQAVRDLGEVIREIVMKPLASRRYPEMLGCMAEMRQVALQEDEIASWNSFLRGLKDACLNQIPNNMVFWKEIQMIGRPMSLISSKEAKKLGGKSDVTEGTAVDFVDDEED